MHLCFQATTFRSALLFEVIWADNAFAPTGVRGRRRHSRYVCCVTEPTMSAASRSMQCLQVPQSARPGGHRPYLPQSRKNKQDISRTAEMYIYILIYSVCIYISYHAYIYILGSSARFARKEVYGMILWDYVSALYYGMILRDNITG